MMPVVRPGAPLAQLVRSARARVPAPVPGRRRAAPADLAAVRTSALFDAAWYLAHNPDVADAGLDPADHYLRHGEAEGRAPGPRFSPRAWVARHPEAEDHPGGVLLHHLWRAGEVGTHVAPAAEPGVAADPAAVPTSRSAADPRPVHLGPVDATWDGDRLVLSCLLGEATPLRIAISGPRSMVERVEPRIEPFLPMAILVAASAGRALSVAAPVDASYLVTLRLGYQAFLQRFFGLAPIDIRALGSAPRAVRRPRQGRAHRAPAPAPLPFSSGIDSFYSLIRLRQAGHPLKALVNIHAGAHGADRTLMEHRFTRMRFVAEGLGLQAVLLDTNFHEVLSIPHTHAWLIRNLSAAYALVGAVDGVVSSTSRAYHELAFERTATYIGNAGPIVASGMAWRRMPVLEVGYDARRWEKVLAVSDEPLSYTTLDVCFDPAVQAAGGVHVGVQCGRCAKCVWVMIALDEMGRLDRYAARFDVARFREEREQVTAALDAFTTDNFISQRRPDEGWPAAFTITPRARIQG